jgi:hypothetical protein
VSGREAIEALVARAIPDPARRIPASAEELKAMRAAAPFGDELTWLYEATGELSAEQFDLFEPALFVDVNRGSEEFGELADLTFFAADFGSSFFAVDTQDLLDLGAGAVVRMDRGDPTADALVPCSETLAGFLEALLDGERPGRGPTLGARAEQRLMGRLDALPEGVEPGPPLDPMAFVTARQERNLYVPMGLAEMLERADGLWLGPDRRIFRFAEMHRVPGTEAVVIGSDAKLGTIAVTLGDWQDLPADRLFAYQPGTPPEQGRLLGRTADVIGMWIEEARRA